MIFVRRPSLSPPSVSVGGLQSAWPPPARSWTGWWSRGWWCRGRVLQYVKLWVSSPTTVQAGWAGWDLADWDSGTYQVVSEEWQLGRAQREREGWNIKFCGGGTCKLSCRDLFLYTSKLSGARVRALLLCTNWSSHTSPQIRQIWGAATGDVRWDTMRSDQEIQWHQTSHCKFDVWLRGHNNGGCVVRGHHRKLTVRRIVVNSKIITAFNGVKWVPCYKFTL